MNYFKSGLIQTLRGIKSNKKLFFLLLFLQIIIIVSVAYIGLHYQMKIFTAIQGVVNPVENANFDANSLEAGSLFTKEFQIMFQSYISLKENIFKMIAWLLLVFLTLNAFIWIGTHRLLENYSIKEMLHQWLKYITAVLVVVIPPGFLGYYYLRSMVNAGVPMVSFTTNVEILLYVGLILYYVLLISFASINIYSWKRFLKSLYLGIKSIHKTLVVLIINVAILSGITYLLYYALLAQWSFLLIITFTIILIILLVLTRIYWISALIGIRYEKSHFRY